MKRSFTGKILFILAVLLFSTLVTDSPIGFGNHSGHTVEAASVQYQTTANLNMRSGASTKHKVLTTIPKGKKVSYVSKSGSWYKVKYGKKTGFVSSAYLKKVATANTKVKQTSATSTTQYQTTANLNMRSGASTKYKRITTIPKGKKVTYVSKSGSWYKVKYGNKTGFVSSSYLKKVATTTVKPAVKPAVKAATTSSKQYQTTANLNMRTGASTKHKVVTTIPKGKNVTYVSKSGSWYKVKYGNKTGFVSSSYLKTPGKATPSTSASSSKPTYIKGILIANKKYALPSNYAPGESKDARNAFNKMAAGAKKDGIGLVAFSTYRSYATQKSTYDYWVKQDGKAAADRYSARPGHSEHQTGLAFDIHQTGKYNTRFEESTATRWMAKNAHKYGFIVRYPKGKEHITGYSYEPWHLRYLGVDTATKVYNSGKTLEEYLGIN